MVPEFVLVFGWVPFAVSLVVGLVLSTFYVLWHRSVLSNERSGCTAALAVVVLTVTMVASALVPVDVFLVSYMKFHNGTFKPWAEDKDTRSDLEQTMLTAYYACYGALMALAFCILPLFFFFHVGNGRRADDEDEPEAWRDRAWRAAKYTSLVVLTFALLAVAGCFLPVDEQLEQLEQLEQQAGSSSSSSSEAWQEWISGEPRLERAESVLVFVLNVMNVVGMAFLIAYTSYGLSYLPLTMAFGASSALDAQRAAIAEEIAGLERQIEEHEEQRRAQDGHGHGHDHGRLDRLEREMRLLQRSRRDLDQSARGWLRGALRLLRPARAGLGALLGALSALVFASLLLGCVDRAINSPGPEHGYAVVNGSLPNPLDLLLVAAADRLFPLDYAMYCALLLFFASCSLSGVGDLGIRFLWLRLYRVRCGRTPPQALVLLCQVLVFLLMALNVLLFSLVPDYATYGAQRHAVRNGTAVERCDDLDALGDEGCVMTRIAYLMLAYHSRIWIFGALYYWLTWVFLAGMLAGAVLAACRIRKRRARPGGLGDRGDDDEDRLLDDSNPFATAT